MRLRGVFLLSLLVFLSSCATSPTGRKQLLLGGNSEVDQMGIKAFSDLKQSTPIETSSSINRYVRCITDALQREAGSSGQWEVVVFRDKAINAFALPGGKIGVYTGILPVANTQDRLAAVLGHEIAHVLSQHGNERMSQQTAVSQGLDLINAMVKPQTQNGQTALGLLGLGAQVGILLPYSRIQESEADTLGVKLMAQAGFDPRESVALWQRMNQANEAQPFEFLSTHPANSTRISDLNKNMSQAMSIYQQAQRQGKRPNCR